MTDQLDFHPSRPPGKRGGNPNWIGDGIDLLFPYHFRESLRLVAEPPPAPSPDDADLDLDNTAPVAADWVAPHLPGRAARPRRVAAVVLSVVARRPGPRRTRSRRAVRWSAGFG